MSRYSIDNYASALQALMPVGIIWTRSPDAVQTRVARALAHAYQRSDDDALGLLVGAFPSTATMMLPEWEATLGLPDMCSIGEIDTIAKRQDAVVSKLISSGGQSIDYYTRIAAAMGYQITITEYRQAVAGMAVAGDAINGEEWPFVWLVTTPGTNISVALAGRTYCGDPLRSWGNRQLECRLSAMAPSHTIVKFGYST